MAKLQNLVALMMLVVGTCMSAGAVTGSGDSPVGALETVVPEFSGLAVEPAEVSPGDVVTISFSTSESLDGAPVVTVGGSAAELVSGSGGDYIYAYTVEASDTLGMADVAVAGADAVGNSGTQSSSLLLEIIAAVEIVPLYGWPVLLALLGVGVFVVTRRVRRGIAMLLLFALLTAPAFAQGPIVSNVAFTQQPDGAGGTEVVITYDLDSPNAPSAITVSLSKNGGADGFIHPITHCSGDIANVTTGTDHVITWDIAADYPSEDIPNAQLRVTADDGLVQHTLTYTAGAGGSITGTTPQTVNHGSDGSAVTAVPATGYHFVNWSDASTSNPRTDTGVTANVSVTATFEADPLPEVTSFAIDSGAASTADAEVTLDNVATESPTDYMVSEASDFSGASWESYDTAPVFTVSTTLGGTKTVYFKVRNAAGESAPVSDTISLTEDTILLSGGVPLTVVWCPSGSFQMGRYAGELDSYTVEDPQHLVTFASGFWMGKYQVTQAQWVAVMGSNPSYFTGDLQRPVEQVSWTTITTSFLTALNTYTGKAFRLPSEAEWEYACRAGTTTRFYWGDDLTYTQIGTYAWYDGNSGITTHAVGTAGGTGNPNAWGLYDMSGNVLEWMQDWYHAYDYGTGAPTDGSAWVLPTGSHRVLRGGGWYAPGNTCRSATRGGYDPSAAGSFLGFRLSR